MQRHKHMENEIHLETAVTMQCFHGCQRLPANHQTLGKRHELILPCSSQKDFKLPRPQMQTPRLKSSVKNEFLPLTYPVCDVLSWQPLRSKFPSHGSTTLCLFLKLLKDILVFLILTLGIKAARSIHVLMEVSKSFG